VSNTLECHSFSEPLASAGELLHTSEQVSTFMTTDLLSEASSILKRGSGSEHLDIPGTFSEHPASPVLLTSKGPHKAQATLNRFSTPSGFALSNAGRLVPIGTRGPLQGRCLLAGSTVRFLHSHWEGRIGTRDTLGGLARLRRSHLQFEDRLRRSPSQWLPLLHCSSTRSCCE